MKYAKADTFFTAGERVRIEQTIKEIESRTIGEVAVMIVDGSDRYVDAEIIGGVLFGSLLSLIVTVSFFHASVWSFIPLSFLFFFPARFAVKGIPPVKAACIGVRRKEDAVRQRALRAFYEKGLHRTKKNTGLLFFLSVLERKVWVLADAGIYERIEQETLNRFAETISRGIREGRACDALCEDMREAGELLARHFPLTPGDIDELSNKLMTE